MAKQPVKATLVSIEDAPPPRAVPLHERELSTLEPEQQIAAFVQKVAHQRAEGAKAPPAPPPLTERQRAQIEAEMNRGKEALAKHAVNLEAQRNVKVERDKSQGYTTPVFRPEDYVPNMNQGQTADTTARTSNL